MAVKHRCFVSYHKVNSTAVKNFVEDFSDVFTAKTVGVTDEDDFINSDDQRLRHEAHSREVPSRTRQLR